MEKLADVKTQSLANDYREVVKKEKWLVLVLVYCIHLLYPLYSPSEGLRTVPHDYNNGYFVLTICVSVPSNEMTKENSPDLICHKC